MRGRTHSVGVVVSHGRDGTLDGTGVAHPTQPPTHPLPYHSPTYSPTRPRCTPQQPCRCFPHFGPCHVEHQSCQSENPEDLNTQGRLPFRENVFQGHDRCRAPSDSDGAPVGPLPHQRGISTRRGPPPGVVTRRGTRTKDPLPNPGGDGFHPSPHPHLPPWGYG